MFQKIKKFVQLSQEEKFLLLEAISFLGLSKMSLSLLPFRVVAYFLGEKIEENTPEDKNHIDKQPTSLFESQEDELKTQYSQEIIKITHAIMKSYKRTPWKSECLVRAIAAQKMLQRRGIGSILHIGVNKVSLSEFQAHAWLESYDMKVTGYEEAEHSQELLRFKQSQSKERFMRSKQ